METQEKISKPEVAEKKEEYSVWALPQEDVGDRMKKLMKAIRSEFGGPEFEPHITVIGPISLTADDAVNKFRSACEGLKPYNATVDRMASDWDAVVYLLIHPTPQVVETSDHFFNHFGFSRSSPYTPHLSLRYGHLSEEEKKKAQEIANSLDDVSGLTFQLNRIASYKTDTEDQTLESWKEIADCVLGPN